VPPSPKGGGFRMVVAILGVPVSGLGATPRRAVLASSTRLAPEGVEAAVSTSVDSPVPPGTEGPMRRRYLRLANPPTSRGACARRHRHTDGDVAALARARSRIDDVVSVEGWSPCVGGRSRRAGRDRSDRRRGRATRMDSSVVTIQDPLARKCNTVVGLDDLARWLGYRGTQHAVVREGRHPGRRGID